MKAEVKDLHGKYYGTEVEITGISPNHVDSVSIWTMGDYTPSHRETEGMSEEELEDYFSDTHYESKLGYNIAKYIADGINSGAIKC